MRGVRYIVLFMCLLFVSNIVCSQPRLRWPELYVGAHAGVLGSMVLFEPSIDGMEILQSPLTVNGGLVLRYAAHKVCALQVEVNYIQRGWNEYIELDHVVVDYKRRLDYIEVPLLMHLYFGKTVRGFVNLGPQVGYCFRDVSEGEKNPNYTHQYAPIDYSFDWGLAGGLGVYYRTKRIGVFQLEARFNYSFGSLFSNQLSDYYELANSMNLSLNFAYLWEIKIK